MYIAKKLRCGCGEGGTATELNQFNCSSLTLQSVFVGSVSVFKVKA